MKTSTLIFLLCLAVITLILSIQSTLVKAQSYDYSNPYTNTINRPNYDTAYQAGVNASGYALDAEIRQNVQHQEVLRTIQLRSNPAVRRTPYEWLYK